MSSFNEALTAARQLTDDGTFMREYNELKSAYADRTWPERLEVMKTCADAGSKFHHRTLSGFRVAIGRGKYAETVAALAALGFSCVDLFTFPLGTDKPDANLRHDSKGFPACCWLFADFR